jgi:uncharacterized protein (TIGR03790 family)
MAVAVSTAWAGGGPENVVLLVNENSPASKAIANLYVELRQVPPSNVIYLNLPFPADDDVISFKQFRERILLPAFEQIKARRLEAQIDYIIYSADFPSAVTIDDAIGRLKKDQPELTPDELKAFRPYASITALTFFAGAVLAESNSFLSLDANWYMRLPIADAIGTPFLGDADRNFRSGLIAVNSGKYAEALQFLEPLAQANPRQFAVWLQIARCRAGLAEPGPTAEALDYLAQLGWGDRQSILDFKEWEKVAGDSSVQKALEAIPFDATAHVASHGFQGAIRWGRNGGINRQADQGRNFLLSTVLAVTRNNGTSLSDAQRYLQISADADASHPEGEFYFSLTSDVRTKTRQSGFDAAIAGLKQLGYTGSVVATDMPVDKPRVLGAIIGEKGAIWPMSNSELVPGAIVDNLTSYGGKMKGDSHTPATQFLKWGAAGASGTVVEPLAIPNKFAHPLILVHYARGCSLAEAYYQSVHGPFQLLIVGDALCQPFARPAEFEVAGLTPGASVSGKIELRLEAKEPERIARYALFLDGVRSNVNPREGRFQFDTSKIADGFHELRVVAIAAGPIETQSRRILPFFVDQSGGKVELSVERTDVELAGELTVSARAQTSGSISVYHNGRVVGTIAQSGQSVAIRADQLGAGHCRLIAAAPIDGKRVQSKPVEVAVK